MEYLVIAVFFILLLIGTFYLPLLMSKYSRVIVCSVGLVISLLNMLFYSFLPLWQFLLVCFVLVGSAAYFLIKYLPLPEAKHDHYEQNNSFSFKDSKLSSSSDTIEKVKEVTLEPKSLKTETFFQSDDRIDINNSTTNEFKKDELY